MANMRIADAIQYCLRPLVQACLRNDIDHRALSEMLKAIYVSAAEKEIAARGNEVTESRIASLTGVSSDEVKQLRETSPGHVPSPENRSLTAALISYWIGNPALQDEWGRPRALPLLSIGDGLSFEEAARAVDAGIGARELLEECLRQGVVSVGRDEVVHLKVDAMIPHKDIGQKATFFAQAVHDHIAAATHNLSGATPPFLERYVWHTQMTETAAAHVAMIAEMTAMEALKTVNHQLQEYEASTGLAGDEAPRNVRIHFGTYFYSTVRQLDEALPGDD